MSVKKFKFVSPGVITREIDQSQLPAADSAPGPMIIGRLPQGPAMEPVSVRSFAEFVEVFGEPVPGRKTGDVWRDGNYQAPTYASYAAQAYLQNSTDGVSVIRLAGLSSVDNTGDGDAGWTTVAPAAGYASNGGAFGLFICPSGSGKQEGYLAAVWYVHSGGAVGLTGSLALQTATTEGVCGLFGTSSDSDSFAGPAFKAIIWDDAGAEAYKSEFNFDPSSRSFIRKAFNTNPQTVRGGVTPTTNLTNGEQYYWLGESYESFIQKKINEGAISNDSYGMIVPFNLTAKADYSVDYSSGASGWFFSQDLSSDPASYDAANMQKLFRVHALEPGKWVQDSLKISIQGLSYSVSTSGRNNYATFTLVLRRADDTDKNKQIVEQFSGVNLNPVSENYIGKRIGDKHSTWDQDTKVLVEKGEYDNISKYVRIEVTDVVQNGTLSPDMLPFGVEGPLKFKNVILSSSVSLANIVAPSTAPANLKPVSYQFATGGVADYTASLNFPELVLRNSSSAGELYNQDDAYFGLNTDAFLENTTGYSNRQFSPDYADFVYPLAGDVGPTLTTPQWRFSLDNVVQPYGKSYAYYAGGSRALDYSVSATGSEGWRTVIDNGWDRFTAPMYGGFDGLKITETEPFRNSGMDEASRATNYAYNTIRTAIEIINDPEVVDMNLAVIPGITNDTITRNLVETCETRGDSLAIIDLPNVYLPFTEGSDYATDAGRGSVSAATTALDARQLDSSYGCTYYPWVQIQDTATSNSRLWVPPSVVALGTMASTDTQTELWFAPAGFNRGGLSQGAGGLPVLNVSQKLSSRDRDSLYESNINPLASFPNEGIVVFGQKTLQITPSALDRINVRRMMIFVKKQISIYANQVLFDQNVQSTWNRFIALVEPFLSSVKNRLGLSDYKLILDDTTTTPDVVDQNIMYAKIFLKPAKAIEYIALDFFITNQGASFED